MELLSAILDGNNALVTELITQGLCLISSKFE
jgi:hypothetical protein